MEQNPQPKQQWEAKLSTTLAKARADQIWLMIQDFFNFHKWYPTLSTCYGIHGVNGELGCIRYCSGFSLSSQGIDCSSSGDYPTRWSTERLISIDHIQRSLSYEIVDSNLGFNSYIAAFKVYPETEDGCSIEWSFVVDPVEGWRLEDLVKKYETGLQGLAKKMEESLENAYAGHANPKWEGKATAKLESVAPEQVWPLLEDFCSIYKWLPGIDTSYKLEGVLGEPGLVRYCASAAISSDSGISNETTIKWCHEKLLAIDSNNLCLSYEVLDNNLGFKSYVSTVKVLEDNHNEKKNRNGCMVQWSFISDPIEGWNFEDFLGYIDTSLQAMAVAMKKALTIQLEGGID